MTKIDHLAFAIIANMLILSGCSKIDTDPTCALIQVQQNVQERTGEVIGWDDAGGCCLEFNDWLAETLQEDLSVDTTVQVALLNNQRLKGIYQDLGIAQAQLVQAGLLKNPIFSFSIRYERLLDSANIIEMGLVQNFLDVVLKPLKIKLACAELELIKSEVAAEVLDLIAETKIAFYSLQSAEQMLKMKRQVFETRDAAYDVARRLRQAGNITDLALAIERSTYEQMKIDLSTSEVQVLEARERLNVLMGLWGLNTDWRLSEETQDIQDLDVDLSCIENHVIAKSLDLKSSRQKMRATALGLGVDNAELIFPELTYGPDSERDPREPWFIGPQFSMGIPIFDIGLAQKASARAELKKQWNEYTALAVEVRSASRVASYRLLNALKQNRYYRDVIIPLEEQITEETHRQLNAMQLGVLDLLLIKQKELDTKMKSISSYRDYWIARTQVEMLLSGRMIKRGM